MTDKIDNLLKYFFLYGITDRVKNKLKTSELKPNNDISPILLSSYSAEGETDLFKFIKKLINEDIYLKHNIFPKKATFLSDVIFPENSSEFPTLKLQSNPFNQYIHTVKNFSEIPEHFSHCFQYIFKIDESDENNFILNFSVLIFYENVTDERDLLEEKKNKNIFLSLLSTSQYYNTYVGKALILVSGAPIFSFMETILEYMYTNYINKKYTYFPIEQIIINIFEKINNDDSEENINILKIYKLYKEPILPYCELNISFFMKLFGLKDIFLIAEYYLCSKNIIIASTNAEFLFPIYYIFMTLFFPLNKNSSERFYKLLVPSIDILNRTIFGIFPTFQFIYYDGELDQNILDKVCKIKEDILIYQIDKDKNTSEAHQYIITKKILRYENKNNEDKIIKIDIAKHFTIIEKVLFLNQEIYSALTQLLKSDITEIIEYFDNIKKTPSFFDFSLDYHKYDTLRNHFIGLFIKFFVIPLNPIQFKINDNQIEIELIDFQKFENNSIANELLSTLYTTPQSDLIYKNEIIKNGKFDNKVLRKIILLDYLLKISSTDKNRSYFEPKSSKEQNQIISSINPLDIIHLFDYNIYMNDDRNIFYYINRLNLYPLQHSEKKVNYEIDLAIKFVEHLEYYQELTGKKKSKDIEEIKKNAYKYLIFFGEDFNLHFGQFINKNFNKIYIRNDLDINASHIDYTKNIHTYEKYYRAILDEAEIFYDLFITQIIVIENKKQLAACAIGLFVSIYIINLLSEISSNNPYKDKIIQNININKKKLFKIFEITNGYYGKFDFLITLLFEIVSYNIFDKEYTNSLIKHLEKEKILPSISVILMYNHNISLNFRVIKEYIEKNNKINLNINKFEQRQTINFFKNEEENILLNKYKTLIENLQNKIFFDIDIINESLVYYVERNKHEHEYNIMDRINDDYTCENANCPDILNFTIQKTKNSNKEILLIYNPKYIIINILKKILDNNSLFIYPYEGVKDDIYQIAMLDELYFQIGFFRKENEEKK